MVVDKEKKKRIRHEIVINKKSILGMVAYASIFSAFVLIVAYLLLELLGIRDNNATTAVSLLLTLVGAIVIFLIAYTLRITIMLEDTSADVKKQKETVSSICEDIRLMKDHQAFIKKIDNPNDFYVSLSDKVTHGKNICLIHLDPLPPNSDKFVKQGKNEYFNDTVKYAEQCMDENKNIKIRRIIGISNMEKLNWVEELIDQTSKLDNIYLEYIKIDDFEDKNSPMTIISCQVIDNEIVFLLNPNLNYMPYRGKFENCMYIKSEEIASIYLDYYDRLWRKIAENPEYGCVIKDGYGRDKFDKNKNRILEDINKIEKK
jgi:hypothetical protein